MGTSELSCGKFNMENSSLSVLCGPTDRESVPVIIRPELLSSFVRLDESTCAERVSAEIQRPRAPWNRPAVHSAASIDPKMPINQVGLQRQAREQQQQQQQHQQQQQQQRQQQHTTNGNFIPFHRGRSIPRASPLREREK